MCLVRSPLWQEAQVTSCAPVPNSIAFPCAVGRKDFTIGSWQPAQAKRSPFHFESRFSAADKATALSSRIDSGRAVIPIAGVRHDNPRSWPPVLGDAANVVIITAKTPKQNHKADDKSRGYA